MQNAQNVGTVVQTEKSKHVVIRDYVYLTLCWKNVKFITSEMELDFEGLIAKTVMWEVKQRGKRQFNLKRLLGQKSM
jgi:hypothetical protein